MLLAILAVLPFQLVLFWHLSSGPTATGFIDYDSPYYVANGREIFERGNGFAGANPFDPAPAAPVIYFHWLTWVLGFGVKVLGMDPGRLYAGIGILASIVGSMLTLRLVEAVLPSQRWVGPLFLLTMWGGGVLALGSVVYNAARGHPAFEDWLALDFSSGWWLLNWGRNFLVTNEAVYHALVAGIWLAVVRQRWVWAIATAALLAATHPFSGVQHLMILGLWVGGLALRDRTLHAWARVAAVAVISIGFFGYYFWFLNQFPEHRALVADWSNIWDLPVVSQILASGPVAFLALCQLRREGWRVREPDLFFLLAFGVTFLLMNHDWFIPSHQPAHFAHGYNWLPLWLVPLPFVQAEATRLVALRPRWLSAGVLALVAGLVCFDNGIFAWYELKYGDAHRQYLTAGEREMFAWMDGENLKGVLLTKNPRLSYLSATYTSARPYFGHVWNTPQVRDRWRNVAGWHERGEIGEWFESIDYVLVDRANPPAKMGGPAWQEMHRNDEYLLLGRTQSVK